MYHHLTEATKRRMILELRRFWEYHPKYRDIVDHIQGKYSFRERPQYGIILKSSSANQVQLSSDNYQGLVHSYVQLAKFKDKPGLSIEWVREDAVAIRSNNGVFPSAPGIYYIQIEEVDPQPPFMNEPSFQFVVDPLLDVYDEKAVQLDPLTWMVDRAYLNGTLRVYEMPGSIPYVSGINYSEDEAEEGLIKLTRPLPAGSHLSVDYRYVGESTGPWPIKYNYGQKQAIPGCVLAFGRRIEKGDIMAVVVHPRRQPTAQEYGGKWELSLDFDIMARDVFAQQEISDSTIMYLWAVARNRLSTEGIEITSVSMGGESEEVYDENGDDYYYTSNFSISVMTDWSIQVPLAATIRRLVPQTSEQIAAVASADPDGVIDQSALQNFRIMESLGLTAVEDPFFSGGVFTFETLK
jgi:hypothetical protein